MATSTQSKEVSVQPKRIVEVEKQIEMHPNFDELPEEMMYMYRLIQDGMTKSPGSASNLFVRDVWNYLYLKKRDGPVCRTK